MRSEGTLAVRGQKTICSEPPGMGAIFEGREEAKGGHSSWGELLRHGSGTVFGCSGVGWVEETLGGGSRLLVLLIGGGEGV